MTSPVQLTKIHYYSKTTIPTISRECYDNQVNNCTSAVIKTNLFGHSKWVLKINDSSRNVTNRHLLWTYVVVFACVTIAVAFGLFFTLGKSKMTRRSLIEMTKILRDNKFKNVSFDNNNKPNVTDDDSAKNRTILNASFCNCQSAFVCLKLTENHRPECHRPLDVKDPTGCGGYCTINTQYCQLLDVQLKIYQCSNVKNILKCPDDYFNCGNRCIPSAKKCDGIVNCSNRSDEIDCACDISTHFQCANFTSCLPHSKRCDGIVDCWDKSDEIDCHANQRCPELPESKFCDGFVDCPDKSDEPHGCQRNSSLKSIKSIQIFAKIAEEIHQSVVRITVRPVQIDERSIEIRDELKGVRVPIRPVDGGALRLEIVDAQRPLAHQFETEAGETIPGGRDVRRLVAEHQDGPGA